MQISEYLNETPAENIVTLAKKAGISAGHMSRLVRGERTPSPDLQILFREITGGKVKDLEDWCPEKFGKSRVAYSGAYVPDFIKPEIEGAV
jgi:transcriptional regulator with XRE-family HTH domain